MKKTFNFKKIKDFDKHINLSIPNYSGLSDIFTAITIEHMPPNGICIDVGCSTGRFLNSLPKVKAKYIGVDKVDIINRPSKFKYIKSDILKYLKKINSADVVILMFVLQFLGNKERGLVLNELKRISKSGAILLIAEKVFLNNTRVNHVLHREHIQQKRKGFSEKEILDKDYDLFGSMFCKNETEINNELSSIGVSSKVWQSYNFMGWCVVGKQ